MMPKYALLTGHRVKTRPSVAPVDMSTARCRVPGSAGGAGQRDPALQCCGGTYPGVIDLSAGRR